jgi:hypothetical protein
MLRSSKARLIALVVSVAALAAVVVGSQAVATHSPADKVVASGASLSRVDEGTNQTILSANIKSSKPSDLMIHVSAECAVETRHFRDGKMTNNEAEGTARLWVEIDGKIVPIQAASSPPQDPGAQPAGGDRDKVTFCHRAEGYDKADGNPLCIESTTGPPPTPAMGCETEEWFQNTKSANAFNWVRLNVGSGDHTVTLKADVTELAGSTTPGEVSEAEAYIGNRTMIIEPTKMANDTLIIPVGAG